jgi:hypothetical protein
MPRAGTPRGRLLFRAGLLGGLASFALFFLATVLGADDGSAFTPANLTFVLLTVACGGLMVAGAATMPSELVRAPPPQPGESSHESFLRIARRAEGWIDRSRRYLLVGGAFAAMAWLPLMAFCFVVSIHTADVILMRALGVAGVLAFTAVAILWWRRLREVDAELREWRGRIDGLRRIEEALLSEP